MRGRNRPYHFKYLWLTMVGAEGFEPPTLCSQSRCATRLRYAPTVFIDCSANALPFPPQPAAQGVFSNRKMSLKESKGSGKRGSFLSGG